MVNSLLDVELGFPVASSLDQLAVSPATSSFAQPLPQTIVQGAVVTSDVSGVTTVIGDILPLTPAPTRPPELSRPPSVPMSLNQISPPPVSISVQPSAEAISGFWLKVGSTERELRMFLTMLKWPGKRLNDDDCAVLSHFITLDTKLEWVDLEGNRIGDAGCSAMAEACGRGALPKVDYLDLSNNQIGDAGCAALAAEACSAGVLGSLRTLQLGGNQIGDVGCTALAGACARGALASCKSIILRGNPASQEAQQAVKDALKNRPKSN